MKIYIRHICPLSPKHPQRCPIGLRTQRTPSSPQEQDVWGGHRLSELLVPTSSLCQPPAVSSQQS